MAGQQYQEKLVLDVSEPGNRNVLFRPLGRTLQTEIQASRTQHANRNLAAVGGTIPGERLTVDFKNLKWSVVHKLNLKENKELFAKIRHNRAADQNMPETISAGPVGNDDSGDINPSSDELATWLYHIHKLVDLKHFVLIDGKLPSYEEIHKMGRVRLSSGNSMLNEKATEQTCFIPKTAEPAGAK
jgi:hypothetical protein